LQTRQYYTQNALQPLSIIDKTGTYPKVIHKKKKPWQSSKGSFIVNRIVALLIGSLALAGCLDNKNPFDEEPAQEEPAEEDPGEEDPVLDAQGNEVEFTDANIPTKLAGDVGSFVFDPGDGTPGSASLVVTGLTLDDGVLNGTYGRNPAYDAPGYVAFTYQDDPLDRHVTALVQETANGAVRGGVIQTGGQFGTFLGGTYYERDGAFTPPDLPNAPNTDDGLVSYAGAYVGMINTTGDPADLLPVLVPVDSELLPTTTAVVEGTIFINVDFADMALNGLIYDRTVPFYGIDLPDLELWPTAIADDGTFFGEVVMGEDPRDPTFVPDDTPIGNYGGIFGGPDASGVAGVLSLDEFDDTIDDELEYGAFVLNQCGTAGEAAICDNVNP